MQPKISKNMTDIRQLYDIYLGCSCRVATDSRKIEGGELFFALKGENFDGNAYAVKALENGAAYAVIDNPSVMENASAELSGRFLPVEDSYRSLADLATMHREQLRGGRLPVLGLTGTNGKTTTKNLITAVLSKKYRVHSTQGNFNNDIGVPLTLLGMAPDTEFAVVEMGANHPDDISKLVRIARPNFGLITNVGRGHLLGFGSFEGVKAAKGELYRWLDGRPGSVIFINEDDAVLKEMASPIAAHFYGYGRKYQGVEILPASGEEPFLRLKLGTETIKTQLVGSYNCDNVLAALSIGEYFGVDRADAVAAIESYVPDNHRSQMCRTADNILIMDAYNANPYSMSAALDSLAATDTEGRTVMLGDMKELGADSLQEHVKIVRRVMECGFDAYLVGPEFEAAVCSLEAGGTPKEALPPVFPDADALKAQIKANPLTGRTILIKGSHSMSMESLSDSL